MLKQVREFIRHMERQGYKFTLLRNGKHFIYRVSHGNKEMTFTMSKSASDWRVFKNAESVIRNKLS